MVGFIAGPGGCVGGVGLGGGCFLAALSGLRVYSLMGLLVPILASLSTIRNFF